MSYLPAAAGARYPWYVRLIFFFQRRLYGRELEPARWWGRMPRAFLAMSALYRALDRRSSPLDPGLRSLVQVRVSQINWCEYCIDLNSSLGAGRGVGPDKLGALSRFAESLLFDDREKAALAYAEAMTDSGRRAGAERIAELRRHFDDQAIVELTALIAFQNMSSKFNAALGIPAQGFCVAPPRTTK